VDAAKLAGKDEIACAWQIINQYKVAKHFSNSSLRMRRSCSGRTPASITAQAALDGIYIVRTSVPATHMAAADCVRNYKSLANVERAFRSFKTIDLKQVRLIHHRLADRVRSHIFLCMLAYYVEWHMREAWRELMFADAGQALLQGSADRGSPATPSTDTPQCTALAL
jgi:transposase